MRPALQRVRLAAVLAVGAFALHQLRYLLAFGGSSSAELARQGHGYLADALPALAVLGLAVVLATLLRARLGETVIGGPLLRRGALFALTLIAIYATQESLEAVLAAGHPAGAAAVVGSGGWIAGPLAMCLGLVIALSVRALERVELMLS